MPKDSQEADDVTTPRRKSKRSTAQGICTHAGISIIISTIGISIAGLMLAWQLVIGGKETHRPHQSASLNQVYVCF